MIVQSGKRQFQVDKSFYNSDVYKEYTWYVNGKGYVSGYHKKTGKKLTMHRLILGLTDPKMCGDHKNGDGLDNRRRNLRVATQAQNNAHKKYTKGGKYRNTYVLKDGWKVNVEFQKVHYYGGWFKDRDVAAKVALAHRKKIMGEWA